MKGARLIVILSLAALPMACVTPTYVDKGKDGSHITTGFNEVVFQVHDAYAEAPPACIAILPLEGPPSKPAPDPKVAAAAPPAEADEPGKTRSGKPTVDAGVPATNTVAPEQLEAVRRALYAHLAPQGRRVEKPVRVDFIIDQLDPSDRANYAEIGKRLDCEALITGRVTEWSSHFYGIYSRVAVGAELKMVRASDGAVLWEASHTAAMHGGTLPLTPIGLAMGVADAATNVEEEQSFRVVDDLARRLIGTIPDDAIATLDDPAAPATPISAAPMHPDPLPDYQTFLASLANLPADQQRAPLAAAIDSHSFGAEAQTPMLDALTSLAPARAEDQLRYADYLADKGDYGNALTRADMALAIDPRSAPAEFERGRLLIKLGQNSAAEGPLLRAAALDVHNAKYLNAVGFVNGLNNHPERAMAAYRMAVKADAADGYALYNIGVQLYNQGDDAGAAEAFYGAGQAYLKVGNYGQAGKSLANLKELSGAAKVPEVQVRSLESALDAIGKKGDQT
jgi:tetratricopeptide (TPR) repeat protein